MAERKLRRLGVNQGDTIAFISIYTPEMIATFYAINKIGAISALMDPRTSPNSLAKYIEKAAIKYVTMLKSNPFPDISGRSKELTAFGK